MKKLLIFMLVLGLASAANATLSMDISGSVDVVLGDTLVVSISSDDTVGWLGYIIVEETGDGALSNGYSTSNAGSSSLIIWYSEVGWGDGYEMTTMSITGDVVAGIQHVVSYATSGLNIGDTARISLWDDRIGYGTGDEQGTADITIIPEPMTVLLLGLGGLFLRRRK